MPDAADSSRISTASSAGTVTKCQLPPSPDQSHKIEVTVIIGPLIA
jgi:hypothetical protein